MALDNIDYDIFSPEISMDSWMRIGGSGLSVPSLYSGDLGTTATAPQDISVNLTDALSGVEMGAIVAYGKKTFTDTTAGWIQGMDTDGVYKWSIGDATTYMDWAVTTAATLTIAGTVAITSGTLAGMTITSDSLTATSGGNTTIVSSGVTAFTAGPTGAPTFTVTQAGAVVASSITATGTINATGGYVGASGALDVEVSGFNFGTTGAIRGGATAYNTGTGWWLGYDTAAYKFFIGTAAGNKLTWDGSTLAVTGTITASAGTIGSFTIGTYLYTGSKTAFDDANAGVHLGSDGIGIGNNVFTVDGSSGALVATSATITGAITASSGTIGSFTIGTYLYTGSKTAYDDANAGVHLGSDGIGIANNLFTVSSAGVITAVSGTVGGCALATTSIGSTSFASGPLGNGWNISNTGTAEFQNVTVRGIIRTSVFEKDTISAVNGIVLVSSADVIATDMTALDASTITISGETTFAANEVIRIKDGTDDEWMLVTNAGSAPTYTVTRDLAGDYAGDSNPIWTKGTAVVSMGVGTGSKTGFILLDSSSANSPYIDIYGRNSNTYSDYTLHGRFGWLQGITDADVGLSTTDVWGLYTDNAYIKGVIVANTGYIGGTSGWVIASGKITSTGIGVATSTGDATYAFWAGDDTPASAEFSVSHAGALVATSATITGAITANSGTIGSFTIGTYLYTGSKTAYNDANAGVHLGSDGLGIGNNVFTVSSAGALVATSATVTGAITATSGAIANFTISGSTVSATNLTLTAGAANTANITVGTGATAGGLNSANAGGDIAFWAGAAFADRATAPFRVTAAGATTSTNFERLVNYTAGEAITANDWVWLAGDSKLYKSDAFSDDIMNRVVGVASENAAADATCAIQETGSTTYVGALTTSSIYYVQDGTTETSNVTENTVYPNIQGATWYAQTFTLGGSNQIITSITLRLKKNGAPGGDFDVGIRATSSNLPTGADLASGSMLAADVSGTETTYTIMLTTPVELTASTKYAIVCSVPSGSGGNDIQTGANTSASVYAGGNGCSSANSGSTWGTEATVDLYFKVNYGTGTIGTTAGTVTKKAGVSVSTSKLLIQVS